MLFFFDYLVYGSADPIFQDLEKEKKSFFFFFFFFFFFYKCSVRRSVSVWWQINYGVQCTHETCTCFLKYLHYFKKQDMGTG